MYPMDDLFCSIMYGHSDALVLFPNSLLIMTIEQRNQDETRKT